MSCLLIAFGWLAGISCGKGKGKRIEKLKTSDYLCGKNFFWRQLQRTRKLLKYFTCDPIFSFFLRSNSRTVKATFLWCAIQWILGYLQGCAAITTGSAQNIFITPNEPHAQVSIPHSPALTIANLSALPPCF